MSLPFRRLRFPSPLVAASVIVPLLLCQCESGRQSGFKNVQYDAATLRTPPGHGLRKSEYPFDDNGRYRADWVRSKASDRTRSSYPEPAVASASSRSPAGAAGRTARSSTRASGTSSRTASATRTARSPGSARVARATGGSRTSPGSNRTRSSASAADAAPGSAAQNPPSGDSSPYPAYAQLSQENAPPPPPPAGAGTATEPSAPPAPAPAASPPSPPPAPSYHRVVSGDTLFSLARRYNTTVADLKRVNGLSGDTIRVGQSLRLP